MLALPCSNQAERWGANEKYLYYEILNQADTVHFVSEIYTDRCMHMRNDFMLSRAKYCICYLRQLSGGTYYTVMRAKKLGRELIML